MHEETLATGEELIWILARLADLVRLEHLGRCHAKVGELLGVDDLHASGLVIEHLGGIEVRRVLGLGRSGSANHLLGLEALVGDGRLDAGDERVLRLQANVDVFGNAHREVIAQTDALGELAEHPDGLMAVDLWLDGPAPAE